MSNKFWRKGLPLYKRDLIIRLIYAWAKNLYISKTAKVSVKTVEKYKLVYNNSK